MKLSLSWIFDHIEGSWKHIDVPALIEQLTTKTAEIEEVEKRIFDSSQFTLGVIESIEPQVRAQSIEFKETITVAPRQGIKTGQVFLLKKDKAGWRWADGIDFGSAKEGWLPALSVSDQQLKGDWKKTVEKEDYILTINNVGLTHRPDLWGHRGFAREIAAILHLKLKPLDVMIANVSVTTAQTSQQDFTLKIDDKIGCRRFAGMSIDQIEAEGSWFWMLHRLLRVDARPIDAIVDTTNYVMLDISQPLHAFDGAKLEKRQLIATRAKKGQKLLLLDDQDVELTPETLIISDGLKPRALAGVMGGKDSCVDGQTHSLLIESASFEPKIIRYASTHYKIRSEASARFEKNLDPNQNIIGLQRLVKLLDENARVYTKPTSILSLGAHFESKLIIITHDFIEQKLGIAIAPAFVEKTLRALDFAVNVLKEEPRTYEVTVPVFRGTKDVTIPEDIVEEIGRFYGLDKIPHQFPKITMKPSNIAPIMNSDRIRNFLAFGASMHEVRNYALYDEPFLKEIDFEPGLTATIANPVTETMQRMVTSLVPNLLKNVQTNSTHAHQLHFFELNKIWQRIKNQVNESISLAGIFYDAKKEIDFYEKKQILHALCSQLGLHIEWRKAEKNIAPWYHPHKTAELVYNGSVIGYAGLSHPGLLHRIVSGHAFIFEFDAQTLIHAHARDFKYKPLGKYQATWFDVSMMLPETITAAQVVDTILGADQKIYDVEFIDMFKKDEWKDKRSLTVRYFARDEHKTLTSQDIDTLQQSVVSRLQKLGADIR